MSETPRASRLSSQGEVVAILVGTGAVSVALVATVIVVFVFVLVPFLQFGGRGQIPADFPVYPGAHLESAFATGSSGCTAVDATWSTHDDQSRVLAFYREQLNSGDWTTTDFRASTNAIYFSSTSGNQQQGVLTVGGGPYGSTYASVQLYRAVSGSNSRCVFGQVGERSPGGHAPPGGGGAASSGVPG